MVDDIRKQGNASQYEYGIRENDVHWHERYPNSNAWEKHVDRFLEHFAEELLETLEPFAYGPVLDSLREKNHCFRLRVLQANSWIMTAEIRLPFQKWCNP